MSNQEAPTISLILVDDNSGFRGSLRALLEPESSLMLLGEAEDGATAIRLIGELAPDIVIADVIMPGQNGIETTRQIVASYPRVKVIALSMHAEDRFVAAMRRAGAAGYVVKDKVAEELAGAIRAVVEGQTYFRLQAPDGSR